MPVITPYMSLQLPTPNVDSAGWASLVNQAFNTIDQHNHSSGRGRQVRAAGISIDSDLSFNNLNATKLRSIRFQDAGAALTLPTDVGCLYLNGGNLYWNNGSGVAVQITAGSSLNAASLGGIGGDYATSGASEFYTSASKLFSFESSSGVKAAIDCGPVSVRDPVSAGKAATVQVPSGLASNYGLKLFSGLPASQKIATLDATGQLAAAYDVDNATLQIVSSVLSVKAGGLNSSHLAASAGILKTQLANTAPQASSSSVTFGTTSTSFVDVTNLSVTITTGGKPVAIQIQDDLQGSGSPSGLTGTNAALFQLLRDGSRIATTSVPSGCLQPNWTLWDVPAAGTHTYKLQAAATSGGFLAQALHLAINAYEMA